MFAGPAISRTKLDQQQFVSICTFVNSVTVLTNCVIFFTAIHSSLRRASSVNRSDSTYDLLSKNNSNESFKLIILHLACRSTKVLYRCKNKSRKLRGNQQIDEITERNKSRSGSKFYDRVDGDLSMGFGGLHGRGAKKQDPPIERDLFLSLEEVFHGCTKKMKISRRVMNEDGHTSSIRDKILTITVKKGWKPGTKITFPKEGDQGPNNVPADIVFIVKDKPHPRFCREGLNLIHTAKVPLGLALTGTTVDIDTLDERILHIPINDIVKPGYKKIVPTEGMPMSSDPTQKGDLIIEFNIEFPASLTPERKDFVRTALMF